jgi:hypothetical protein
MYQKLDVWIRINQDLKFQAKIILGDMLCKHFMFTPILATRFERAIDQGAIGLCV